MEDLFPGSYLTLIAIIQSLAFSLLVSELLRKFDGLTLVTTLQYLGCFLVVCTIWHEYFWASWLFNWIPGVADSFIPFLVGGLEALLVFSVGRPTPQGLFAISGGLLSIVGGLAYLNTDLHFSSRDFTSDMQDFYTKTKRAQRFDIVLCLFFGVVLVTSGALQKTRALFDVHCFELLSALAVIIVLAVQLICSAAVLASLKRADRSAPEIRL